MSTIDNCRVSWGKIIEVQPEHYVVKTNPLIMQDKKLKLGPPTDKKIISTIDEKTFIKKPKPGDWVSFHWNFICEKLNSKQVKNLKHYTNEAIKLANLTI